MARRPTSRAGEVRARVAEEAARIMREQGVRDFLLAKRKAADRLGIIDRHALPANQEIADALAAQQRLFEGAGHEENLRALREEAVRVMRLLERFSPRLVGPVLAGTATPHSDVSLHLFAEAPEQVAFLLLERGIRYQEGERRLRLGTGEHAFYPSFAFDLGGAAVEAVVFPERGVRQPPMCPVSGGPMRRARRDEVERLLDE
jgi:predicted nucleotidyltransferase